jgi:ubiquitin-protein ligase E3 C
MQEEGHDAGGLFKEFLVNLAHIVFNPNYGLFLLTEKEKELYPNA